MDNRWEIFVKMSEDEKLLTEAKKLPWEVRLGHSNWKVRSEANVDLASVCDSITDPNDPRLRDFGHLFRATVGDSNAVVQEKALDALIAYLLAADADAVRYAKDVCDAIAAKCLTGPSKTVEKAQEAFLLWVELGAANEFLDTLEQAVKNEDAKAVVPAVDVMLQALSGFGSQVIPPERIIEMLPELLYHHDENVCTSAKRVARELCRRIGTNAVMSRVIEKMKNTLVKELQQELEKEQEPEADDSSDDEHLAESRNV